ncbi:MAG: phosphotransferase family protein [Candidatus Thorarchaeota archaeon]
MKNNLELLFRNALDMPDLTIDRSLGGMSNINLLARSEKAILVLRTPALRIEFSSNHYEKEFRVCTELARNELSPRPLQYGVLDDDTQIPFMAYHYEMGVVHANLNSMSHEELSKLKTSMSRFQNIEVQGAPTYSTAAEYLHYLHKRTDSFLSGSETLSKKMKNGIVSLDKLYRSLEPILEGVNWSGVGMHGDLRPSNVLFQDERVLFLDWSEFCKGDTLFDFAYLVSEPVEPFSFNILKSMVSRDLSDLLPLRGLALFSCASWTLERLIRCELNQVSLDLSSNNIIQSMETYVSIKTEELVQILKQI